MLAWVLPALAGDGTTALADDLLRGTPSERHQAATALATLPEPDVAEAVVAAVSWAPLSLPGFTGEEARLGGLTLTDTSRRRVATELVTWRVALTLVGSQYLPPRLGAELDAVLASELGRYGAPTHTIDWLHLLAAAGGDPEIVLSRLQIASDARWSIVLDEVDLLRDGTVRDVLPLLAHRSPIVRERAAERFESSPSTAIAALSRAWRWAPGRSAPLRGEIAVPELERTEPGAERWSRKLVKWARRSSRQRDDSALIATLSLLADPTTTTMLSDNVRLDTADGLLKVARRDDRAVSRVILLMQAMDAVIRRVPFDEGERPAPEEVAAGAETWVRIAPR